MKDSRPSWMPGLSRVRTVFVLAVMMLGASPLGGSTHQEPGTPEMENPDFHGALPWEIPEDGEKMVVHRIVDGDTFQLTYPHDDWYYPTRLIGIQAPEMDGPYTREGCYGQESREFLIELLPIGSEVVVQKDITNEDRNGRRLRHVFVVEPGPSGRDDAYLVAEILVLGGFAEARDYPPDDLYDDVLAEAEEIARSDNDGLWGSCAT
ncbi:MAG: thermonuclease family protein [Nocardioidaceae bacterium]|nr:thermonuclease family protein [Nocardioidaceae bacterium]